MSKALFPARAPFEDVFFDILGELLRTPRGNRYLLKITSRLSKLTGVVPLKRARVWDIFHAFDTQLVSRYGAPRTLLSANSKQMVVGFSSMCATFWGSRIYSRPHITYKRIGSASTLAGI